MTTRLIIFVNISFSHRVFEPSSTLSYSWYYKYRPNNFTVNNMIKPNSSIKRDISFSPKTVWNSLSRFIGCKPSVKSGSVSVQKSYFLVRVRSSWFVFWFYQIWLIWFIHVYQPWYFCIVKIQTCKSQKRLLKNGKKSEKSEKIKSKRRRNC